MRKILFSLFIAAGFVLMIGLPFSSGHGQGSAAPLVSTTATFRVAVADPTVPPVDVWVDGVKSSLASLLNVMPLSVSGYAAVLEGPHTVSLYQAGTSTAVGPSVSFNTVAKSDYSLILLPGSTWQAAPLVDAKPVPVGLTANVRLVNLSPNNNPVSLAVNGVVPPDFSGIAYPGTSASYLNMNSGVRNLQVQGTIQIKAYDFLAGHDYSVFIFWDPAKSAPTIYVKTDADFTAAAPTSTVTAAPTAAVTPGVTPTVEGPGTVRVFIPLVRH